MKYLPVTNDNIWPQLKHFNKEEAWGDYKKMDVRLLWELDWLRDCEDSKFIINCGYETSGHAPNSFHKLGMAVDLHLNPFIPIDAVGMNIAFLLAWKGGIGVYPYWRTFGWHLDIGPHRQWVRDEMGIYHYGEDAIYFEVNKWLRKKY